MARITLLFWFLLFLPLLATANAASSATLDNCIDFDMSNVEELISTLRTVKNPEFYSSNTSAKGDKEILQPFGNLKSDWSRLHLLHDALPEDSVLKNKFKHLFRILIIAHYQVNRLILTSASGKLQDAFQNQSTESVTHEDRTYAKDIDKSPVAQQEELLSSKSQEMREKLKTLSTTSTSDLSYDFNVTNLKSSAFDLGTTFPESIEDRVDAMKVTKSMTKVPAEHSEEKEINVSAYATDLDPPTKSLPTTVAPITTLLEFREPSTADSILIPVATVSVEEINFSTYMPSQQRSPVFQSDAASADKTVNSTGKTTKQILGMESSTSFEKYTNPINETISKDEFEESSTLEEYSSVGTISNTTITEIQALNSMSSENPLKSTIEETKMNSAPQPAITVDPVEQFIITEEYSLAALVSSFVPVKKPSFVSIPSEKLLISSTEKNNNISSVQYIMDPLLGNRFTAGPVKKEESVSTNTQSTFEGKSYSSNTRLSSEIREYSGISDSTKALSTENTSIVSPTIEENVENELKSLNNQTESSLSESSTLNLRSTTDSADIVSYITSTIEKDREIKQTNQTKVSTSEKSIRKIWSTTDSMERVPSITPTIEKSGDNKSTSQKKRIKVSISETTTDNVWITTDSVESLSSVTPVFENNEQTYELTSLNNEKENLLNVKSTPQVWRTTDFNERVPSISPSIEENEKINSTSIDNQILRIEKSTTSEWGSTDSTELKSTSENSSTKVSISDKSISNDKSASASTSPRSTSDSTTSQVSANTTKFVAETEVIDASNKTTNNSVSIELSTKGQENSTNYYADDQTTIVTKKNEINISKDSEPKNKTEMHKAELTMEKTVENTSKESKDISAVTESTEPLSISETWLIKTEPYFVKNPLNIDSSRSNSIFRDFKHGSDDSGTAKNLEPSRIVLYESGAGAKTGNVWRPQLVRQPPVGNNIWRINSFAKNVGPYGSRYRQPASSADTKADIRKDETSPATKIPGQGSRMNLLRSRKRDSANADIEKQFRWFYRQSQAEPAHKSRDRDNGNIKIKIQCKKT